MDIARISALLTLGRDVHALAGARQIAGTVVNHNPGNMHNCCAATLSCLLDFAGIPVGVREAVVDLAGFLEDQRGWTRSPVSAPITAGDVGVFVSNSAADLHHIYLVLDATDQKMPLVADNQGNGAHQRPVMGGPMPGVTNSASATSFFLRAN